MTSRTFRTGFVLVHVALVASLVMPTFFLWDSEHIGNPLWHPHAKFHGVQLWFLMVTAAAMAVVTLWRTRAEARRGSPIQTVPLGVALTVPLAFWVGEFAAWPVPGTDVRPDLDNPNTFPLLGFDVYGNAFGAALVAGLFIAGYLLLAAAARAEPVRYSVPERVG